LEKDLENLMLLVSLWNEGEGTPWQPFYRGAKRWPGGQPMWPLPLYFVPKIVEGRGRKEGEGGRSTTNHWPASHVWPPLNPYFHPSLHLAPIMLTPLTKIIKSKANSLHHFPKFYLFIIFFFFEIFDFILCNDKVNMP
jgi:hypothetical protein